MLDNNNSGNMINSARNDIMSALNNATNNSINDSMQLDVFVQQHLLSNCGSVNISKNNSPVRGGG